MNYSFTYDEDFIEIWTDDQRQVLTPEHECFGPISYLLNLTRRLQESNPNSVKFDCGVEKVSLEEFDAGKYLTTKEFLDEIKKHEH